MSMLPLNLLSLVRVLFMVLMPRFESRFECIYLYKHMLKSKKTATRQQLSQIYLIYDFITQYGATKYDFVQQY